MTYRMPELLLVGAAANLVLEASAGHFKVPEGAEIGCDQVNQDEATGEPDLYASQGNW